jgi:hypothetical protein
LGYESNCRCKVQCLATPCFKRSFFQSCACPILGSFALTAVTVGSIVALVMALIFSMKIYADRHAVEAEQMHRCALEINEIRRNFANLDMEDPKILKNTAKEYNFVLQKYSINHTDRDFQKYKYEHRWEFLDLTSQPNYEEKIGSVTRSLLENSFERFSALGAAGACCSLRWHYVYNYWLSPLIAYQFKFYLSKLNSPL